MLIELVGIPLFQLDLVLLHHNGTKVSFPHALNFIGMLINFSLYAESSYGRVKSLCQLFFEISSDYFTALWRSTCPSQYSRGLCPTTLIVRSELDLLHCVRIGPSSFNMCGSSSLACMMHITALDRQAKFTKFGKLTGLVIRYVI